MDLYGRTEKKRWPKRWWPANCTGSWLVKVPETTIGKWTSMTNCKVMRPNSVGQRLSSGRESWSAVAYLRIAQLVRSNLLEIGLYVPSPRTNKCWLILAPSSNELWLCGLRTRPSRICEFYWLRSTRSSLHAWNLNFIQTFLEIQTGKYKPVSEHRRPSTTIEDVHQANV